MRHVTIEELMLLPFTELEMNHIVNLPISKLEELLGLQAGEYEWARDFPKVVAKQRRLLAEALYAEMFPPIDRPGW